MTACIVLGVAMCAMLGYITTQRPKVWCDRQWAGLALYKGGYRSWSIHFCDGYTMGPNGKFVPVVVEYREPGPMFTVNHGLLTESNCYYRTGYYRWPKFAHNDLRELLRKAGEAR